MPIKKHCFDGWNAPAAVSITLHSIDEIRSRSSNAVPGTLHFTALNEGYEVFDLIVFTGDAALAADLAAAISEVVARHKAIAEDAVAAGVAA